jgi:hypothetical protein
MPPKKEITYDSIVQKIRSGISISELNIRRFIYSNPSVLLETVCHIDYTHNLRTFYHIHYALTNTSETVDIKNIDSYASEALYWLLCSELKPELIPVYVESLYELYTKYTQSDESNLECKSSWTDYIGTDTIEEICTSGERLKHVVLCLQYVFKLIHGEDQVAKYVKEYLSEVNISKLFSNDNGLINYKNDIKYLDSTKKWNSKSVTHYCVDILSDYITKIINYDKQEVINIQNNNSHYRNSFINTPEYFKLTDIIDFIVESDAKLSETQITVLMKLFEMCLFSSIGTSSQETVFTYFSSIIYELCDSYWSRIKCLNMLDNLCEEITTSSLKQKGISTFQRNLGYCVITFVKFEWIGIIKTFSGVTFNAVANNDRLRESVLRDITFNRILRGFNSTILTLKPIILARYISCADEVMEYRNVIQKFIGIDELSRFIHAYTVHKSNRTIIELNNKAYTV